MNTESRMRNDNTVQVDVVTELRQINGKLDNIQNQMGLKAERHELEGLRTTVEGVRINGSGHAQEALRRITESETRLGLLERDQASKQAVERLMQMQADQQRSNKFFWIGLVVSCVGVFAALSGVVISFLIGVVSLALRLFGK